MKIYNESHRGFVIAVVRGVGLEPVKPDLRAYARKALTRDLTSEFNGNSGWRARYQINQTGKRIPMSGRRIDFGGQRTTQVLECDNVLNRKRNRGFIALRDDTKS